MNIVFRADASSTIGTGHVMRCLTLADTLRENGATCHFICREHPGHLLDLIRRRGFNASTLPVPSDTSCIAELAGMGLRVPPHADWLGVGWTSDAEQTIAFLSKLAADWLIVDHYALDEKWERQVRTACARLMVIDDLADRRHDCDLLLDQNWFGDVTDTRYEGLVPASCRKLLGPRHALIKPEYAQIRALMPPRDGIVRRVLVFMGGSDPTNQTAKVLAALNRPPLTDLAADVVIGVNHPDPQSIIDLVADRKATMIHVNLPSLAGLMARADLMISAGGSTSWERMCLGLPTVVISIADNQTPTNRALMEAGYIHFVGEMNAIGGDDIASAIQSCLSDPEMLKKQSRAIQELVTGSGTARLAEMLNAHFEAGGTAPLPNNISGNAQTFHTFQEAKKKSNNYTILILSDKNSWIAPFIADLVKQWEASGNRCAIAHALSDAIDADFCFCLSFSQILPKEVRARFQHTLVVHESELPKGRGWAPMSWQILEGSNRIPITLLEAAEAVDSGQVYLQDWIDLNGTELNSEWRTLQAIATQRLCMAWVDRFPDVVQGARTQEGQSTYYARRRPEHSELNPEKTIAEQFDLLRIVDNERYPAFFKLRGRSFRIFIEGKTE